MDQGFYGGRRGASFVLKARFDGIDIPDNTVYKKKWYARVAAQQVPSAEIEEGEIIIPLIERTSENNDDYVWGLYELNGQTISYGGQSVTLDLEYAKGMKQCFEQGNATTSIVGYGEYVIIDTISGLQETTNIDNCKIYKRGYDSSAELGGAEFQGQLSAYAYTYETQVDWSNVVNYPANLISDADYVHTDNNYTTLEKDKLNDIEENAQVNIQSDWEEDDENSDAFIKNKPVNLSDFNNDLDIINDNIYSEDSTYSSSKISQLLSEMGTVQSDWNEGDSTSPAYIKNKPAIGGSVINDGIISQDKTFSSYKIENTYAKVQPITQAEYDELEYVDPMTWYLILPEDNV